MVVDDFLAPCRALDFFGDGETDRICNALTEGACRGLDAAGVTEFGVACGAGTPLAEIPDLLQRHIFISGQIHQRVKQHRAVTSRKDKTIAVGPVRGLGVEFEVFFKQNRRHIGHAHRHAGMARVGGCDRIQRQSADGGGFHPMVRVGGAQGCNIQGDQVLFTKCERRACQRHISPVLKIKRDG